MKVTTGMSIPLLPTLHAKGDGGRQGIRTGIEAGGVPSSIIGGEGMTGNDAMLESTTSEVLVVLERHADGRDDDEDSHWTTNFFYPPRSRTIPKVV